jgi:hypothetical protein
MHGFSVPFEACASTYHYLIEALTMHVHACLVDHPPLSTSQNIMIKLINSPAFRHDETTLCFRLFLAIAGKKKS